MARPTHHRDTHPPAARPTASVRSTSPPTATGARRPNARGRISASATTACRCALVRALGIVKLAAAQTNRELGLLDARPRRRHHPRRARGDRRQARRPFPAGGLADRFRHADQHEPQRGDRQPRQRAARRQARRQEAGSSQRPRQHEPVVERFISDGDAYRRGRRHHRRPDPGAGRTASTSCAKRKRRSPRSSRSAAPIPRMRRR